MVRFNEKKQNSADLHNCNLNSQQKDTENWIIGFLSIKIQKKFHINVWRNAREKNQIGEPFIDWPENEYRKSFSYEEFHFCKSFEST